MISYQLSDASGSTYTFITLQEVKDYLKVDGSADDGLLYDMIDAASSYVELQFKQTLRNRIVTLRLDKREQFKDLLFRPVDSITSVTYYTADDTSGSLVEASGDFKSYGVFGSRIRGIELDMASDWDELEIVFASDGSTVPADIKLAVLAHIKTMYDNNRSFFDKDHPTIPPVETIQLLNPYKQIVI